MSFSFNEQSVNPTLFQFADSIINRTKAELNCCRVAIVEEFNASELVVRVQIVNKAIIGINKDGTQETKNYPPIYAKVCYCNPNLSVPIYKGTAGILLFSDREIESYFINGAINNLSYERMHDITDAIFIPAVYSFVNVDNAKLINECLHLFFGNSDIQVKDKQIDINTDDINASNNINVGNNVNVDNNVNITKDLMVSNNATVTDTLTANVVNVVTGASGQFLSQDNKTVTVVNGIITDIA